MSGLVHIILATNNLNKRRELLRIARQVDLPVKVELASTYGPMPDPEETGDTLLENARIKLEAFQEALAEAGAPDTAFVLAEDSGLFVDVLGGEPGVVSARWAGDHDDEANNRKLVRRLRAAGVECSPGEYRAVVGFGLVGGGVQVFEEGVLPVQVCIKARGAGGFGYDPHTYVRGRSLAEMGPAEKDQISHRAQAFRRALDGMAYCFF